jgi:ribosomal-protein-alanine N-acetyltransferase
MATTAARQVAIRPMTTADLRQVRRIERAAYGPTMPGTPFERELANGLAQYLVAVEQADDGTETRPAERGVFGAVRRVLGMGPPEARILGFVGVWYTVDQLHVVTVAVDPAEQHRGIGQRLLLEVFALAQAAELHTVALEVRASNDRARGLYEAFGFRHAGMLRSYYSDNSEDAVVMVTPELESPDMVALLVRLRAEHARKYGEAFAA